MLRKYFVIAIAVVVVGVTGFVAYQRENIPEKSSQTTTVKTTTPQTPQPATGFDKQQYSTTDPASLWVVVNKQHALQPVNYKPAELVVPKVSLRVPGNTSMQIRKDVGAAMESMFSAAAADGAPLMLSSGFRSYDYQVSLYGSYVKAHGQQKADTFSARPGFSEHQTGMAFDVEPKDGSCDVDQCFANTTAGKWVAAHAYEYGFIMRYPADKVTITGYEYEPWHFRYVGKALAAEMHEKNIETLEEFFGISGGTSY